MKKMTEKLYAAKENLRRNMIRLYVFCLTAMTTFIGTSLPAHAASGDISQKAEDLVNKAYGGVFRIAAPLAALMLLIAGLKILTSGTQKGSAEGIDWIKKILAALLFILCIGLIITTIQNVTKGNGWNGN